MLDLRPIPPLRESEHALLQAIHLVLVGPDQEVDELRVGAAEELCARDHARAVQRSRERERGRPGDDRLVEVEERRFHLLHPTEAL